MSNYLNSLDTEVLDMFTFDSKEGKEVVAGIECSMRLLQMLHKITYNAPLPIIARRILNSINEFYSTGELDEPE